MNTRNAHSVVFINGEFKITICPAPEAQPLSPGAA